MTLVALSRSPTFRPPILTCTRFDGEHASSIGSASPVTVNDPAPPSIITLGLPPLRTATMPLVCPEIMLR